MRHSIACVLAFLLTSSTAFAATFTVTNTNSSGNGSLAKAITDANATTNADVIEFQVFTLGTATISGDLPAITQPLTIDGYSNFLADENDATLGSNASLSIQLDGAAVPTGQAVLDIQKGPTTIQGIAIKGIGDNRVGIEIGAAAEDVAVLGCFIGVAADGTTDGSFGTGVVVRGDAVSIGNGTLAGRNLISGNDRIGVELLGSDVFVRGNVLGVKDDGQTALGNGDGINVASANAGDILIGGLVADDANYILQNGGNGITVEADFGGTVRIEGNNIGYNHDLGIDLGDDGVTPNDEGDEDDGPNSLQNYPVLTFVNENGNDLHIEGYFDGPAGDYRLEFFFAYPTDPTGYGEGNVFKAAENVTSPGGRYRFRFIVQQATVPGEEWDVSATLQNTDTNQTSEFSKTLRTVTGGAHLVVTNSNDSGPGSLRQAIEAANATAGSNTIDFLIPTPTKIQALTPYSITQPVVINGYSQAGSRPNESEVGTDAVIQIEIEGPHASAKQNAFNINTYGTLLRGLAIHSASGSGVSYTGSNGGVVEGSFLGTNRTGTTDLGNTGSGISAGSTIGGRIGGIELAQRNLISGNGGNGVTAAAERTLVQGNLIGTNAASTGALGNTGDGIHVTGDDVVIGGDDVGANLILFNGEDGISVEEETEGTTIMGNHIDANGELGIDLDEGIVFGPGGGSGVTTNDPNDGDTWQNYPIITEVSFLDDRIAVIGTLDVPSPTVDGLYTIRVFRSNECDPSGQGEGQVFLKAEGWFLSGDNEGFQVDLPPGVDDGSVYTATATNETTDETSEFSPCFGGGNTVVLCGDASLDDDISAGDALLALKTAVGSGTCQICVCDVNGSSTVTSSDALLILREAVGQSVNLSCSDCD